MTDDTKSALDAVDEGPLPSEAPGDATAAPGEDASDHASVAAIIAGFGDSVLRHRWAAGRQAVVWVTPDKCHDILAWLKDDDGQRYDMMSDVTAVDYGGGRPIEVVYQMFSTAHKHELRVRCPLPLDALEIESVCDLWKAADWLEREVFDLFGVTFTGHPDLRRILMPDDYAEGHPLRKDFPLRGRFSRAEQTLQALNQNVDRFYLTGDMDHGAPQEVAEAEVGLIEAESSDGEGE
jgi:NADH-quinone oxidoreductase subunit C